MTALLIIGGIVLGLFLLGAAPLTVIFTYKSAEGITVKAGVPPVTVTLYPDLETRLEDDSLTPKEKRKLLDKIEKKKAKKAKKDQKKKKTEAKKDTEAQKEQTGKKKKSAKRNIRYLARMIGTVLKKTGEAASVTIKRFHVTVGTKDAAETAYLYGVISAATAYLLAVLDVFTKTEPSRKNVGIYADFTKDTVQADIAIRVQIRLFPALKLFLSLFFKHMAEKSKPKAPIAQKGS